MTLRRLADRLAAAPPSDCGSGSTWINYGGGHLVPGVSSSMRVGPVTQTQVFPDPWFEQGEGWSPA